MASGVYLVADDDGGETRVVERTPVGSNTSVMTEPADVQEVLARVEPAVVAIQVTQDGPASQLLGENVSAGSGFVISPDGFIVTNNHVISDETGTQVGGDIEVTFSDGETMPAEVVGRDPVTDLAVIQVDGENLPFAEIGDSDSLQVGDDVVAIGNALALEGGLSVTRGIVSALGRQVPTETGTVLTDAIQTDAAINRGNSGGPLVNASGEVVGINTAIADPQVAQNVGFAIAIAQAMPVIEQLRQGEDVEVAFLGVQTQTVTPRWSGSSTSRSTGVRSWWR
ncbi:MAG: trypsin-like peptidase domain-containing protein [Acidimicrobiia bacterium]|nr:trypsin-like peptidase domain-containing protein [Acidimicrobiia bacterium]